jgi:hypothetical protein
MGRRMLAVVVLVQEATLVDGLIVLLAVPRWIFLHRRDRVWIMFLNRQSLSDSVAMPIFVVMLDPSDYCSCQFWHQQSNHQYHDSTQPDLHRQAQA